MSLGKKIVLSKLLLVIIPLSTLTVIAVWRSARGFDQALSETRSAFQSNADATKSGLREMALTDLTHQARGTYDMCVAAQEMLDQRLQHDLRVARDVLQRAGALTLSDEMLTWSATNQLTNETVAAELPAVKIGDTTLGQNADPGTPAPVVDTVRDLAGSTCTVFQRMNAAGDMLRVCTNVQKKDGQRAIGTFIPARNADGAANPVVASVLAGQTYTGRAFVVDRWYIAAYEGLRDAAGDVIGMLYVGIPQESAESLRKAIMSVKVGKTGYIYVLNGTGTTRGQYVISKDGKRDGENIWDVKDADGSLVIRSVCEKAVTLQDGEIGEIRYPWKNADDPAPREKVVKLAYFRPWDWVIGVGSYIDEFEDVLKQTDARTATALTEIEGTKNSAQSAVVGWCVGTGGVAVLLAVLVGLLVTRTITKPVNRIVSGLTVGSEHVHDASAQVASASQALAQGNTEQASSLQETSSALEEMSAMTTTNAEHAGQANTLAAQARQAAQHGNETMQQLHGAMRAINDSAGEIQKIIKVIEEIAFQTNLLALNAAVEAARAGEHGKGFAVVAEEVRNLAQRSAGAAKDTTRLIEDSVNRARQGTAVTTTAADALQAIVADVSQVAELLTGISKASHEQAQGVEQINTAVSQMDRAVQQNAAGAEESAAAAEELSSQAQELLNIAGQLARVVGGGASDNNTSRPTVSERPPVPSKTPAPTARPPKARAATPAVAQAAGAPTGDVSDF